MVCHLDKEKDKETWWWNKQVQGCISRKKLAKKNLDRKRDEENRQEYKDMQRRLRIAVAKAKREAFYGLYERLDSKEEEKDLYRLVRQRD